MDLEKKKFFFLARRTENILEIECSLRKQRNKCVKLDIIITYLVTGGERKFSVKWGT